MGIAALSTNLQKLNITSDVQTGSNSLGNINRDITESQIITKDKSRNVDVYVNSDTIETLTNTEKRNQLVDRITNPGRLIGEAFQFGGVADDLDNAFSTVKDGHINAPTNEQLASMTPEQQQQVWADYDSKIENQGVIKTSGAVKFDNAVKYTAGTAQDWIFHVNDEGGIAALGMGEGNDFSKIYGEHKAANELLLPTRNNLALDLNGDGKADFDGVSVINNATDNSVETNQLMARIMVGTIAGFDVETLLHTDAPAAGAPGQAKGVTQDAEGKPTIVGINVVKTDISNVDDYVTTIAEEGRHAGSDNDINANIFARQFASNWNDQNIRDNSPTGGQFGVSHEDWLAGNSNNRTLNTNNERIGQLDIKDLHFRQLSGIEADKIIEIADQQSNGDANLAGEWRKRLTRQALRQVDANHYATIPEDTEARQLLGGKSAGQANETFIDENGTTRNIFFAQGDEFKNAQTGKANAKNDTDNAGLYEEAGKGKSLTTLEQTPRNAPSNALPEEKVESGYVTWMNSCNATGGSNCNAYAYDQFAKEEQAKSDLRATLSELENTASTTKKTCDANDEACKVKADLNAYNQRLAGELKSMGVVASTAAEFLNLPYGVFTTVDSITQFVEQNGDSVVQLITENPTAAAAAGVTAVCAATPSCRAGLKNWIDPPVSSPSVVTKVDDVPKGGVTKADEAPKKEITNNVNGEFDFYKEVNSSATGVIEVQVNHFEQLLNGKNVATMTSKEKGDVGEQIAKDFLVSNGHTDIISIQNASGNGIDVISRAPDGRLVFTEVKTTGVGNVGDLSKRQQDPVAFVNDILSQAATGTGRYGNLSADEQLKARKFLREIQTNEITSYAIGVDLKDKILRISPWRND